jgi:Xaa-Pro dipeptidase
MSDERLARFRGHLVRVGLAGAVIGRPANVLYLTGYPASPDRPCFAVVGSERVAVVGPGDAASIQRSVSPETMAIGYRVPGSTIDRVADVVSLSAIALEEAIERVGLAEQRIGIEEAELSAHHAAVVDGLAKRVALDDHVASLRRIKDEGELALIRTAVAGNDAGFGGAARAIAEGIDEFGVQSAVIQAIQQVSGVPIDVLGPNCAFISGPRTMLAAAPATPRLLERGDLMIVDINPVIRNYKGDTTRTFSVGPPTAEQQRVHDSLVRGLEAVEKSVRPGVRACDVFATLVEPIVVAGFGSLRFHGGHAIGLEHLERPYIIPGDELRLEEGMVIALEPGVYLPGIGGIRVEDNYLVTARGLEVLSHYPRELVACG